MEDLENLQQRLAQEEATLTATHEQIEAAHGQIAALNQQIGATQRQIEATESQIKALQDRTQAIEKRIALLREYIAMVEAGEEPLEPVAEPVSEDATAESDADTSEELEEVASDEPAMAEASVEEELEAESIVEDVETADLGDLELTPPVSAFSAKGARTRRERLTFDNIDDDTLAHEVLPRAQTFEEELLLLMAYHRKAIKPKDINRAFRRLDHTPKFTASEKAITSQVAQEFLEWVANGRIALTREGRDEAQRLLDQLSA